MTKLQKQIENLNNEMSEQLPKEILQAFSSSIIDLEKKELTKSALQKGMKLPHFNLKTIKGTDIASDDLLNKHEKIILAFFRGSWCPYCNLELKALQDSLDKIENKNIKLLGISPQKPNYSMIMSEQNNISFDILFDKDNTFAKQLEIVFQLQDFVIPHYEQLGIKLNEYNGNEDNTLPIPAIYVVDKDYNITYSFVDPNYMNRVDIDDLISNL